MKKIFTIIASLFIIVSCRTIILKQYGVKQPVVESESSLNQFLTNNGFPDTLEIYVLKDLKSYYEGLNGISFPDAYFFNQKGQYVSYKLSPQDCNAKVGPFLENAKSLNETEANDSVILEEKFKNLVNIKNGQPLVINQNADGYVVLTWAKFLGGKINREKSLNWLNIYHDSKAGETNIQLIFLNIDYQDSWGITNEDIPKFDFTK